MRHYAWMMAGIALWGGGHGLVFAQGSPVTLQWFETSWETMEDRTADAFMAGYHRVWTPPIQKSDGGGFSVGYNCFDRFDLGSPGDETRYGTRAEFEAVVAEQDKAAIGTFVDLIVNHNSFSDATTPGFEASGDYPGFVLSWPGTSDGDFHPRWDDCGSNRLECRIAGLIDIDPATNNVMIRHPVDGSDPLNITPGTQYDQPDPDNYQFYSDTDLPANSIGIHPFNVSDPMEGDPVAENATGLLMRSIRYYLEVLGVDGFRIDAVKHMEDWFFRDFYDRHVWQRGGTDLAGNPITPFSFGEVFDGGFGLLDDYLCKGSTGNCNTSGGVQGNRDVLDFPLFFTMKSELTGNGFGSWVNIVNSSIDAVFDGNANDGDFGVQFAQSHDDFPPGANNVAHAYILMRVGQPIVYFRAGEFGSVEFPKDGRGDALGGQFGTIITSLVDVRNEYGRSFYIERWLDSDVLIFERNYTSLVCLNDRNDNGYDTRTVTTNFPQGLRLVELTGNATDAQVDPNDDIYDVVTVGSGGQVTVRVPRNNNANGEFHGKSYVIYGPFNPDGDLTLTNVASVIPADGPGEPNATRRLSEISVIQSDSFEVKLETTDPDATDGSEDDLAMLRMDAGLDINGNGVVDSTDPSFVGYGYENFLTESVSLESGGVDVGGGVFKGRYRQVVDATQLTEGRHYLSVIAFRSRPPGSPEIFETWRKVILLDRVPAEVVLVSPEDDEVITSSIHQFVAKSPDRTATQVHMFLDQQPGTDVVALADQGQGLATQIERDAFQLFVSGLTPGNHRIDLVAYEETRPDAGVTTVSGILVEINGFDGLGDMNEDGKITNLDIFPFVQMVQAGNQFDPNGDINGDGIVDSGDVQGFGDRLLAAGVSQAMVDEMIKMAMRKPPAKPGNKAQPVGESDEGVEHG